MDVKRCRNCAHFIEWSLNDYTFDHTPEGVCTAPRPSIGVAPNREVQRSDGKNCNTFKESPK